MNSEELANYVEAKLTPVLQGKPLTEQEKADIIRLCREGILGPGRDQYEVNGTQKFETMTLLDLISYVEEEGRDLINYGVMVLWRLEQINSALQSLMSRGVIQNLQSSGDIAPIVSVPLPGNTPSTSEPLLPLISPLTSSKEGSAPAPKPSRSAASSVRRSRKP